MYNFTVSRRIMQNHSLHSFTYAKCLKNNLMALMISESLSACLNIMGSIPFPVSTYPVNIGIMWIYFLFMLVCMVLKEVWRFGFEQLSLFNERKGDIMFLSNLVFLMLYFYTQEHRMCFNVLFFLIFRL